MLKALPNPSTMKFVANKKLTDQTNLFRFKHIDERTLMLL